MPADNVNAEPIRHRLQRVVRQFRLQPSHQVTHVQELRWAPGQAGALMLAPKHGEVEVQGMTEYAMPAGKIAIALVDLREALRRFHRLVGYAVNRNRFRRNRFIGIDQRREVELGLGLAIHNADRADFKDAAAADIERGRFGIKGNGSQGP
jgi:hypothetical protein